jgi:hypothetical protein
MFTLNRVTTIGLGAGFVLVGCASPVGETEDPTAQASTALTEETAIDEAAEGMNEEAEAVMPAGLASAFEIPNAPVPSPPSDDAIPQGDDEPASEKWFVGRGLGWGGLGWGGLGWGGLGWGGVGGVYGAPGYAYGYASPWGFGYSRAIGYGTTFGYPGYGGFFW